jgi:hypothetical protein
LTLEIISVLVVWASWNLTIEWLWVSIEGHLLMHHVGRNLSIVLIALESKLALTRERHWLRCHVFVWIKSTKSYQISKT